MFKGVTTYIVLWFTRQRAVFRGITTYIVLRATKNGSHDSVLFTAGLIPVRFKNCGLEIVEYCLHKMELLC